MTHSEGKSQTDDRPFRWISWEGARFAMLIAGASFVVGYLL